MNINCCWLHRLREKGMKRRKARHWTIMVYTRTLGRTTGGQAWLCSAPHPHDNTCLLLAGWPLPPTHIQLWRRVPVENDDDCDNEDDCDNLQRDIDSSLTYNHGKITNPCKGTFVPCCLFYKMITIFSSSSNYVDRLFLKGTTDYVPKITDWLQLQCWKAVPDTGAGGKSDRPTSRSINIKHILSILHGCTMLQCQFLRYQAITATSYPIIFKCPQKHVLHLEHVTCICHTYSYLPRPLHPSWPVHTTWNI